MERSILWFMIGVLFASNVVALSLAGLEKAKHDKAMQALNQAYELLNANPFEVINVNQ